MMKHLIILSFVACFITSYGSAQEIPTDEPAKEPRTSTQPVRAINTFAVTFIASSDTCNLRINGMDYGEIAKNSSKTIKLPLGNYRLFFESLETGKTMKERSFRLTRDKVTGGTYTYPVTFKQQD